MVDGQTEKQKRVAGKDDVPFWPIDKLQEFLLELGKGFSFVARQKRVTIEGDRYYQP